jgi:hypothetical protein
VRLVSSELGGRSVDASTGVDARLVSGGLVGRNVEAGLVSGGLVGRNVEARLVSGGLGGETLRLDW